MCAAVMDRRDFEREMYDSDPPPKRDDALKKMDALCAKWSRQAFERYCAMEHVERGKKYKLTFIGPVVAENSDQRAAA